MNRRWWKSGFSAYAACFSRNATVLVSPNRTRGIKQADGSFSADPSGQYLRGTFAYCTCVDCDGDGLIRTSTGLGDILPWGNDFGVDDAGGVSTAEDECILNYTRIVAIGARTIAIDANNDAWVGGSANTWHEKLSGVSGEPVPGTQFQPGCGGYGGLVDHNGILWSARGGSGLLRFEPNPLPPPAGLSQCLGNSTGNYGLGIDPISGHIWHSSYGGHLFELDPANGTNVLSVHVQPFGAQGVCVDANGHVWMAEAFGSRVWHLAPVEGVYQPIGEVHGLRGSTGVAVDKNGNIWVAENEDRATRIDPTGGPINEQYGIPVGITNLHVHLGPGAGPYNYSDMTGFVSQQLPGKWTVIHDSGAAGTRWGKITWSAATASNSVLTVEVRAAEAAGDLASQSYTPVSNGVLFANVPKGRFIQIQATFTAGDGFVSPILYDLTVCPDAGFNEPPTALAQDVTTNTLPDSVFGTADASQVDNGSSDPEGLPLTIQLGPSTNRYPIGTNLVTFSVTDSRDQTSRTNANVIILDQQPPSISCFPVTAFADPGVCTSTNVVLGWPFFSDNHGVILVTNNAPSVFNAGTNTVTWTVADPSGNSNSCEQLVIVGDPYPPTNACAENVYVDAAPNLDYATNVNLGTPVIGDNCGTIVGLTNDAPTQFNLGITKVTWSAQDGSGNSVQWLQGVVVNDNEPPEPTNSCSLATTVAGIWRWHLGSHLLILDLRFFDWPDCGC